MSPRSSKIAQVQDLADEIELTQYGVHGEEFRNSLRIDRGENELSLLLGRLKAMMAALMVTKTVPSGARARYTTVGALRACGFIVKHSPTKGNSIHVSVYPPQGDLGPLEWDAALAETFDKCFSADDSGGPNQ